jgi:hypothetical protein
VIDDVRQIPDDDGADESWQRVTSDPASQGVFATRTDFRGGWNVTVAVMEFVRQEPLEGELRRRIGYISYATAGAAADMINYYEENVAPWYGNQYSPKPVPLHRLKNQSNRGIICDGSFTNDPAITAALAPYSTATYTETDSCDEYPFAST